MSHGVVAAVKDTLAVNDCQIIFEIHVSIITTKNRSLSMWTATYRYSYAFVRRDRLSGHLRSGLTEEKPAVFGVLLGELRRMLLDIREQACSQLEALLLAGNVATDRR